jgi:hypothetical protein
MGFRLYPSRHDRLVFVSSVDEFVDTSTPEKAEAYRAYLYSHDLSSLTTTGDPIRFICRPLTRAIYEYATRDARGIAVPRLYCDAPTARKLLMLCCYEIEGKVEKDWPERKHQVHFGQVGLSQELADDLPSALCLEAAEFLLSTLPIPGDETADDKDNPGKKRAGLSVRKGAGLKKK